MGNKFGSCSRLSRCNEEEDKTTSNLTSLEIKQEDLEEDDEVYKTPRSHMSDEEQDITDRCIPCFVCKICVELKPLYNSFNVNGCNHFYCTLCIVKYIVSKFEDNVTHIPCPESTCESGMIEPDHCRLILPHHVHVKWGIALSESAIVGSNKYLYCPYKDCSAMMFNESQGEPMRVLWTCPYCVRQFFVQCRVPWHSEIECAEFEKLNKDEKEHEDIMLMKLAQNQNWKRCPNCRYYVEKKEGCKFINCRSVLFC
ncbi:hypothetical protein EZV62_013074 [Acer yangbiense]|uniref:RBR-type E3 ubiquitin transferase n=1 Tax=Acer yangbiense TaxID=1000413 RepID=A0A5C7HX56_9ROSI|nr:hypothetical protein EZV62_013074 [Acer yangbiense]